jgi:hypothetical protein
MIASDVPTGRTRAAHTLTWITASAAPMPYSVDDSPARAKMLSETQDCGNEVRGTMTAEKQPTHRDHSLTREDVISVAGEMADARIAAIIATGATLAELEEAVAFAAGENDVMGDMRRPAAGRVADVYDILTIEEAFEDEPGPDAVE